MKIGISTFTCPDWTLERAVDTAVRLGYQGIEIRCDANHGHGVEVVSSTDERRVARSLLESTEIVPCCLGTSLQFTQESVVHDALARIELAADLGCEGLRVFCGDVLGDVPLSHVIGDVSARLAQVAHFADEAGVGLWLETHDSASHAGVAGKIVRRANHHSVGLVYDNLHPYRRGESLEATVAALGNLTRLVHFHDGLRDPARVIIRPFGEGELPLDEMFAAIVKMGFDGFIVGEWFYDMYGEDTEKALARYHADMSGLAGRHGVNLGRQPR